MHADPLCCTGTDPTETSLGSGPATKPESFNDPLLGPHRNGSGTDPLQSRSRNGPVSEPNMDAFRDSKRIRFGSQGDPKGIQKETPEKAPNGTRNGIESDPNWIPTARPLAPGGEPFRVNSGSVSVPLVVPACSVLDPIWILFRSDSDPFRPFLDPLYAPFRSPFWIRFCTLSGTILDPIWILLGSKFRPFGILF